MNKSQAIKLLESEGWTQADAKRALELINFNTNPDEITIRRAISSFAGSELNNRQRLQAAQKGLVTKKNKEIERTHQEYSTKVDQLNKYQKQEREKYEAEIQRLSDRNQSLELQFQTITSQNNELIQINDSLKKDNKALKNLIDAIKLKLAIDVKRILQYEDSEIRKALIHIFKSTLG
ncbi:hypothetical protein H6G41_30605 [Tolypothrix sp. FACHB-123]|uniref:hypothetical protein n=1 Tax=Tolypothrix sp. FACHB-123 TaxID=2692868 RepID=UPI001683BE91|nr:hypothetical protein [Tolypothrix sp. FACHB-123]MBD2358899.1 hypothetical protein [Tolypothrix sp. FACHB-123]